MTENLVALEDEFVFVEKEFSANVTIKRTAKTMQQTFAENSGLKGTILWDLFKSEDIDALKHKLEILLPNIYVQAADERRKNATEKYNKNMEEKRSIILNNIWKQRKYSNGDLLTKLIFVICTPNIKEDTFQLARSQYSTEFSCHILIRIRKCFVDDESENCCMIFVDENGRVYQNWIDYINNNTLQEGVLVVPKNGIYDFTPENEVILEFFRTPACKKVHKALQITDKTTGIIGMTVGTVGIPALFLPVGAPLLISAGVVGGAINLWSIGRSTANLVDRGQHKQSINIVNRQARSSWINIGGSVLSLGATGAHGLTRYAASGKKISNLLQGAINGMNIASIAVNGVGAANSIVELILRARDDEDINALDILQLGASLIFFTHSIYNFRYVSQIIEKTYDGKINEFRKELSNRQRKMFDNMYKETIRIKGHKAGKIDVIRSLAKIPDKQYLNDIYEINSILNKKNIQPSFSGDENILLNNEIKIDSTILRQNIQYNENYLQNLHNIPNSYNGNEYSCQLSQLPSFNENVLYHITALFGSTIKTYFVDNESNLRNCFEHLYEKLQNDTIEYLLDIAQEFVRNFLIEIELRLKRIIPFEQILWDLFEISTKLHNTKISINVKFLKDNIQLLMEKLKKFYEKNKSIGKPIKCKICKGFYRISPN